MSSEIRLRALRAGTPIRTSLLYLVLVIGGLVCVFPYLMVVFTAFKTAQQLNATSPWLPSTSPTLHNFIRLFDGSIPNVAFLRYIGNSVLFTAALTVGDLIFSTFAAYAFARLRFPGREQIFWLYLATLMVPNVVTMIPLYLIMTKLGWVDTWMGLVAPYLLGSPYSIFLMRQFFRSLPSELEDAAKVDGATTLGILVRIILPVSKPILGTVAILSIVFGWQNFLWPLVISSDQTTRLLTVGIANFAGNLGVDYNMMMAASFVALVPMLIMFLLFQRTIVRSVIMSGLK